jgi:hypothetical protein
MGKKKSLKPNRSLARAAAEVIAHVVIALSRHWSASED